MTNYKILSASAPFNVSIGAFEPTDRHRFGMYWAQEAAFEATGSGLGTLDSPGIVTWLKDMGMNFTTIHVMQKRGIYTNNVPCTNWGWGPWGTGYDYLTDWTNAFEAAGISYCWMSWRTWSAWNRWESGTPLGLIPAWHVRDHYGELARTLGERYGSNPGLLGVVWDFEYDGRGAVKDNTDPSGESYYKAFGWDGSAPSSDGDVGTKARQEWYDWQCNTMPTGFGYAETDEGLGYVRTLRKYTPGLVFGAAPTSGYFDLRQAGSNPTWGPIQFRVDEYDPLRQYWYNHENTAGPAYASIVSQGQRSWSRGLCWHIGLSLGQTDIPSSFHIQSDHKLDLQTGATHRAGVTGHLLACILENPYIITFTMTSNRTFDPCPVCGRTEDSIDMDKRQACKNFGDRYTQIDWDPPIAKWGDLPAGFPQGDPSPYISTPPAPGIAYMLDTAKLWIVNFNDFAVETTVSWIGGGTHAINTPGRDFTTDRAGHA